MTVPPSARIEDTSDQPNLLDGIAPVARPLPAFQDRIGLRATRQRRTHDGSNSRIHSLGVTARREDTDTNCAHFSAIFH